VSFFDQFTRSAWRLEVQPFYQPDAEEFGRWQRGVAAISDMRARWLKQVADATAAGRYVGRVLVVSLPLSDYWQWRLETARSHVAAGEDIRVAVVDYAPVLAQLDTDFWLLDDTSARVLAYSPDGRLLDVVEEHRPKVLRRCRHDRDLAMAPSVPLQEIPQPA